MGLASFDLFDDINFNEWFHNELQHEIIVAHDKYESHFFHNSLNIFSSIPSVLSFPVCNHGYLSFRSATVSSVGE